MVSRGRADLLTEGCVWSPVCSSTQCACFIQQGLVCFSELSRFVQCLRVNVGLSFGLTKKCISVLLCAPKLNMRSQSLCKHFFNAVTLFF